MASLLTSLEIVGYSTGADERLVLVLARAIATGTGTGTGTCTWSYRMVLAARKGASVRLSSGLAVVLLRTPESLREAKVVF